MHWIFTGYGRLLRDCHASIYVGLCFDRERMMSHFTLVVPFFSQRRSQFSPLQLPCQSASSSLEETSKRFITSLVNSMMALLPSLKFTSSGLGRDSSLKLDISDSSDVAQLRDLSILPCFVSPVRARLWRFSRKCWSEQKQMTFKIKKGRDILVQVESWVKILPSCRSNFPDFKK